MIREVRFSSVLYGRLNAVLSEGGCAMLPDFLRTLSVSQFRTAGCILGERVAAEVAPEVFWELFITLHSFDNRAFLVTMLHALAARLDRGEVSLDDAGFHQLLTRFTEVDADKALRILLPLQQEPQQVSRLLGDMQVDDATKRIRLLLPTGTIPCHYILFLTLRQVEHNHSLLVRVAASLIRQGDSVSFNMASLMKAYFGLKELKGTFSLHLQPWQLSRIETSYEAFRQTISF